jgi:tetratricopeptide (TPR) repeat protein
MCIKTFRMLSLFVFLTATSPLLANAQTIDTENCSQIEDWPDEADRPNVRAATLEEQQICLCGLYLNKVLSLLENSKDTCQSCKKECPGLGVECVLRCASKTVNTQGVVKIPTEAEFNAIERGKRGYGKMVRLFAFVKAAMPFSPGDERWYLQLSCTNGGPPCAAAYFEFDYDENDVLRVWALSADAAPKTITPKEFTPGSEVQLLCSLNGIQSGMMAYDHCTVVELKKAPAPSITTQLNISGVPGVSLFDYGQARKKEAQKLNKKGMASYKKKTYAKAIELFTEALKANPAAHMIRYNLGCTYALSGDVARALQILEQFRASGCEKCLHFLEKSKTDTDYDKVRGHPTYKQFMQQGRGKNVSEK